MCYRCCNGELCNSYIPGINITGIGSDVSTLSGSGVLATFLVLTGLSMANVYV